MNHSQHPVGLATRGFAQTFGLHPLVAFLTVCTDMMLFGGEAVTLGTAVGFSFLVSIAVAYLAYRAQMKFYGDDSEAAMIKAGVLGLLTAIPTAIPMFLYVPAGVIGFFRRGSSAPQINS